jgi:hypothetical protein
MSAPILNSEQSNYIATATAGLRAGSKNGSGIERDGRHSMKTFTAAVPNGYVAISLSHVGMSQTAHPPPSSIKLFDRRENGIDMFLRGKPIKAAGRIAFRHV